MSTAAGKTRITVTLGDGVLAMLDEACARSGLTRSAEISRILQDALEAPISMEPEQMIRFLQGVMSKKQVG